MTPPTQQFSSPLFPTVGTFGTTGIDHSPMTTIHTPTTHPGAFAPLDLSSYQGHLCGPSSSTDNAYNLMPPNTSPYISPEIDHFSALTANALGLQNNHNPAGLSPVYNGNNGMDQHQQQQQHYSPEQQHLQQQQQKQQHYTPQGSVSPYGHSPLQGQGGFISDEKGGGYDTHVFQVSMSGAGRCFGRVWW